MTVIMARRRANRTPTVDATTRNPMMLKGVGASTMMITVRLLAGRTTPTVALLRVSVKHLLSVSSRVVFSMVMLWHLVDGVDEGVKKRLSIVFTKSMPAGTQCIYNAHNYNHDIVAVIIMGFLERYTWTYYRCTIAIISFSSRTIT